MGIRFSCPNGHNLNVKVSLAGKRAICPECGVKIQIPDVPEASVAEPAPTANVASPAPEVTTPWPAISESVPSSVVIALDAAAPSVVTDLALPSPPLPPASLPPAPTAALEFPSPVVPPRPPMVSASEPQSPEVQYQIRRDRRRRNQAIFAVVLLVMVFALGITLVWVLWRNANPTPAEPNPPAKTGQTIRPRPALAEASAASLVKMRSGLP